MSNKELKSAVLTLVDNLGADEAFLNSWHANIACAAVDNGVDYNTAQKIASTFLSNLTLGAVDSLAIHNKLNTQEI